MARNSTATESSWLPQVPILGEDLNLNGSHSLADYYAAAWDDRKAGVKRGQKISLCKLVVKSIGYTGISLKEI